MFIYSGQSQRWFIIDSEQSQASILFIADRLNAGWCLIHSALSQNWHFIYRGLFRRPYRQQNSYFGDSQKRCLFLHSTLASADSGATMNELFTGGLKISDRGRLPGGSGEGCRQDTATASIALNVSTGSRNSPGHAWLCLEVGRCFAKKTQMYIYIYI